MASSRVLNRELPCFLARDNLSLSAVHDIVFINILLSFINSGPGNGSFESIYYGFLLAFLNQLRSAFLYFD